MGTKDLEKETILEEQKVIAEGLNGAEEALKLFRELSYNDVVGALNPLDRARYDLAILYSVNSMYWMYLRSLGTDTKNHPIMDEMNRIKKMTERIKEMTEKTKKRPFSVDSQAAHRMVKHELWQPANKKAKLETQQPTNEEDWDEEAQVQEESNSTDQPEETSNINL